MRRRPPRSTRTDTLFPYTTLFRSQRQRRIFLTERAVGADGQQPLAAPPPATCDRQPPRRRAYIDETATVRVRDLPKPRIVAEPVMRPADEIEPAFESFDQLGKPGSADRAAHQTRPQAPRARPCPTAHAPRHEGK